MATWKTVSPTELVHSSGARLVKGIDGRWSVTLDGVTVTLGKRATYTTAEHAIGVMMARRLH
jgi:hypothetical protein